MVSIFFFFSLNKRYAQRHSYPILHYVALPRIGALKTLLDTLSSEKQDEKVAPGALFLEISARAVTVVDATCWLYALRLFWRMKI